jgi:hypothetical protein
MDERKPDAATLANLADAASKLAALLTENDGRWGNHWLHGGIALAATELAIVAIESAVDSPIWAGWPIDAPALAADIAAATAAIKGELATTADAHNRGESASGKARDADVEKLARAAERLSAIVKPTLSQPAHSPDFRSVNWFGTIYSFTANQAAVVRVLWEAWEAGTPEVGDETLLRAVDEEAPPDRLANLFRGHPAWGAMIVTGGSKGSRRLAEEISDTREIRA